MHCPECEHTAHPFSTNFGFQWRAVEAISLLNNNGAVANTPE